MATDTNAQVRPIVTRAQAKASGAKRYFTTKPCPANHISERWVSTGGCVACVVIATAAEGPEKKRARQRASYAENPERHRAYAKKWASANADRRRATAAVWRANNTEKRLLAAAEWRAANPEKCRSTNKAYRLANKDKLQAFMCDWRAANQGRIRETSATWRANNPEKVRANRNAQRAANREKYRALAKKYKKANPDKVAVHNRNRRARKQLAPGKHSASDIKALLTLQRGKCAHPWCKKSLASGYHVDHIVPLALEGTNDRNNLQLLCAPCNLEKRATHPIDFAQRHGMLL
jgi:HNH endonuclease